MKPLFNGYVPKTVPYEHQLIGMQRALLEVRPNPNVFALFMEQRTGKSKLTLDCVAYWWDRQAIDAMVVISWPAGVHRKWITDDIPEHMPDRCEPAGLVWRADRADRKWFRERCEDLLEYKGQGVPVLSLNVEALITESFLTYMRRFLRVYNNIALVFDESDCLSTPGATRTKKALVLARQPSIAKKQILTGTPAEHPLDVFSQYALLDPTIIGFKSFYTFKGRYAEYEEGYDPRSGRRFPKLKNYRNLDELNAKTAAYTYRVLRSQCADLPPVVYQKRYFQLTPRQRKAYEELRSTYTIEIAGIKRTAANVLARYLRLQQVTSNHWPGMTAAAVCMKCDGEGCDKCDGEGVTIETTPPVLIDPQHDPRSEAFELELKASSDPVLGWARFVHDVDRMMEVGTKLGRNPVRFDGTCTGDQKEEALRLFQSGKSGLLAGSPMAGGRGRKMTAARLLIYYSNSYSLRVRQQSEDRPESLDRKHDLGVVDLVAEDTNDEVIIESMRSKKRLVDMVTGDPFRDWL